MFEIQAAKLAEKRSKNPDVKAFAAMMIHDHTQSTAALKAAIKASGATVTLPSDLPADKKAKLDELSSAAPAEFDKAYMESQVMAHQDALNRDAGLCGGRRHTADQGLRHQDHGRRADPPGQGLHHPRQPQISFRPAPA